MPSFGSVGLRSLFQAFAGAVNLTTVPATLPPTVTILTSTFGGCPQLNDPRLSGWQTGNVTSMAGMFAASSDSPGVLNQPLNDWDVSKVTDMSFMFRYQQSFNQPLASWDTRSLTTTESMFEHASSFNQPLSTWKMGKVTSLYQMFALATSFNGDLRGWDTGSVEYVGGVFAEATAFDQPLGTWDVRNVRDLSNFLSGATAFSTSSYDQTLNGWATQEVMIGRRLETTATYSPVGLPGRTILTGTYGWSIADGGPA